MSSRPLNIAILWHMHQPFYKDLVTGEYILPWVRLHAVKDYYDMSAILDRFPQVRLTINVVPSLLLQVEDYVQNKVSDRFLSVTQKPAADLSLNDRVFLLQNFFMANWETMVHPYPRYHDLLLKRGRYVAPSELVKVAKRFTSQELLDLQVWFNLTWFGFIYKNEDEVIKSLIAKGKYFSEQDKTLVIAKQLEVMGKVIPKYRELSDRGQIELTTTPFYHPILPLLCDTNVARESMPFAKLPETNFRRPEDAAAQIRMAIDFHQERFGRKPEGMWPSEGSVSEQVVSLIGQAGIRWIATDEGILEQTIRKIENRSRALTAAELCQPYLAELEGTEVAMIFRNHFISDQIGFVYQRWQIEDAINDFVSHINNIKISLPEDGQDYLLSVILDGENAWEYYQGGGKDFLEAFYSRLSNDPSLKTVKVGDYLRDHPPRKKIHKLFAGSWINNNFRIWIGHEEDNLAWKYLNAARLALDGYEGENSALAWQEIYIAEGSDWCWWYGDDHSSDNDAVFDSLFRKHLKNVYSLIGRTPPKYLDEPIKQLSVVRPLKEPVFLLTPQLDGEITNYYEWLSAGYFDITRARGAMHQIETLFYEIYYGFSLTNLFVRLGINLPLWGKEGEDFSYALLFSEPKELQAKISFDKEKRDYVFSLSQLEEQGSWKKVKELSSFGVRRIIEMGIPFAELGVKPGEKIEFTVVAYKEGQELERWPRGGVISVTAPTETYADEQWYV